MRYGMLLAFSVVFGCSDGDTDTDPMDSDSESAMESDSGDSGDSGDTGDSSDSSDSGGGDPGFATDIYPIIASNCSPCHTAGPSGGLAMGSASEAYSNLVGVDATGAPGKRVVASSSATSYLVNKLEGTQGSVGGSGDQMPKGRNPLSSTQIGEIKAWIDDGALP